MHFLTLTLRNLHQFFASSTHSWDAVRYPRGPRHMAWHSAAASELGPPYSAERSEGRGLEMRKHDDGMIPTLKSDSASSE